MLDFLLLFLGLKSWDVDCWLVKKNKLNMNICKPDKKIKTLNNLKMINQETPSPFMSVYTIDTSLNPTIKEHFYYYIYTIYSILIFLLQLVQPIYLLYMYVKNTNDLKYLSSFFIHLSIPMIYGWQKWYFRKNHLDTMFIECKKCKSSLIIITTVVSIILNFIDFSSFYNDYYWISIIDNINIFTIVIVIEWIYSRCILFLFVYGFMFIMKNHINVLNKFKHKIENDEINFEDSSCLSKLIQDISLIRHHIEITIDFYNNIISILTVIGAGGLGIFIRDIYKNNNFYIEDHDRYLIFPYGVYIITQGILIYYMYIYSSTREDVLKYIKSVNFVNKFLTKTPANKILRRSNYNVSLLNFNTLEETSTAIDWMILGQMLSEKWLDFTILGISSSDGGLIKRSIAMGGTLLFLINILQNNN